MLLYYLEEISVVANGVPNESDNSDILKYFFLPLYLLKSIKDLLLFFLLSSNNILFRFAKQYIISEAVEEFFISAAPIRSIMNKINETNQKILIIIFLIRYIYYWR